MGYRLIFMILLLSSWSSQAQKEDYNWIMGFGQFDLPSTIYKLNHFQFPNDSFKVISLNKSIPFFGACAIISDTSGNLLCYTNGINLYNRNHEVMPNGQGFHSANQFPYGYPFNQSVLILPIPDTVGIYLMLDGTHLDIGTTVILSQLRYSVIDFQDNSLGKVILKNIPVEFTADTLNLSHLTVVKHANGKDWWLMTSKFNTNQFRKFVFTKEGIAYHDDQPIGDTIQNGPGYSTFSPSGCWYARYLTYGPAVNPAGALYIYRFDRSSGNLSAPLHKPFPRPEYYGGVAFSPNSRFLYVAKYLQIFQYDLYADDILASETVVAEYDGMQDENGVPLRFYGLQLAPDNKIYGNIPGINSRYMHVIDHPNLPGTACNVIQHAIYLPAHNFGTLPNLPYYRLYEATISCDSLISGVESPAGESITEIEVHVWPVPAADVLYFSAAENIKEPLGLFLFDGLGRLVFNQPDLHLTPTETVYLNELPSGMYYYILLNKSRNVIKSGKVIRTQ